MIQRAKMMDQDSVLGYPVYERIDRNFEIQAGPFRLPTLMLMEGDVIDSLSAWEREIWGSFYSCCEFMVNRFLKGPV